MRMVGRRPPRPSDITIGDLIRNAAPLDLPEPSQPDESPFQISYDRVLVPTDDPAASIDGLSAHDLDFFHFFTTDEFLNPDGFGYIRDRQHVAGFISHRFVHYPVNRPASSYGVGHWRFESLDLISLLKHPEPVAYVSKHLPRMDELRDAPTRPLDELEAEHLAKLRAGEEVSSAQGPRRVRMMGAIRARADCLKCHSVEPNELLGAFSYDLRRDR
jgi:hypothetical protein